MNDSAQPQPNQTQGRWRSHHYWAAAAVRSYSQSVEQLAGCGETGPQPFFALFLSRPSSSLFCLIYRLCVDLFYLVIRGTACRVYVQYDINSWFWCVIFNGWCDICEVESEVKTRLDSLCEWEFDSAPTSFLLLTCPYIVQVTSIVYYCIADYKIIWSWQQEWSVNVDPSES